MLELPRLPESVVVGVKGRAPVLDGPAEYVAGREVDAFYLLRTERVRLTHRVDARREEHLVHVDVAQAGYNMLV